MLEIVDEGEPICEV